MPLVERQHAPQVRNNDMGLLGKTDPRGYVLNENDPIGAAVGGSNFAADLDNVAGLDGIDASRAELAGKCGEHTGAGANLNDY
jgi:hypothetical protein